MGNRCLKAFPITLNLTQFIFSFLMGTDLFSPDKWMVLVFTLSATPTVSFTYPISYISLLKKFLKQLSWLGKQNLQRGKQSMRTLPLGFFPALSRNAREWLFRITYKIKTQESERLDPGMELPGYSLLNTPLSSSAVGYQYTWKSYRVSVAPENLQKLFCKWEEGRKEITELRRQMYLFSRGSQHHWDV